MVASAKVALLRWPAEAGRAGELAAAGVPRLWLVEAAAAPPEAGDCLEDWVRVPAAEADLAVRSAALAARARRHGGTDRPSIDGDGVVRHGERWVPLPPVESRLTAVLLDRWGALVSREALALAGWPAGAPGRNALDVHVLRLRRRLAPLGLVIRTVRSRGYLIEAAGEPADGEPVANLA